MLLFLLHITGVNSKDTVDDLLQSSTPNRESVFRFHISKSTVVANSIWCRAHRRNSVHYNVCNGSQKSQHLEFWAENKRYLCGGWKKRIAFCNILMDMPQCRSLFIHKTIDSETKSVLLCEWECLCVWVVFALQLRIHSKRLRNALIIYGWEQKKMKKIKT